MPAFGMPAWPKRQEVGRVGAAKREHPLLRFDTPPAFPPFPVPCICIYDILRAFSYYIHTLIYARASTHTEGLAGAALSLSLEHHPFLSSPSSI